MAEQINKFYEPNNNPAHPDPAQPLLDTYPLQLVRAGGGRSLFTGLRMVANPNAVTGDPDDGEIYDKNGNIVLGSGSVIPDAEYCWLSFYYNIAEIIESGGGYYAITYTPQVTPAGVQKSFVSGRFVMGVAPAITFTVTEATSTLKLEYSFGVVKIQGTGGEVDVWFTFSVNGITNLDPPLSTTAIPQVGASVRCVGITMLQNVPANAVIAINMGLGSALLGDRYIVYDGSVYAQPLPAGL